MPKISLPPTNDRLLTRLAYALVGICLAFSLAPDLRAQSAADEGPAKETAVAIEKCSVKNFGKVNDRLFRGGQPTSLNYHELAGLGIKTILDLREDAETFAAPGAEAAGLKYINLPLNAKRPPTREESEQFLRIMKDDANGPVFIHCAGGRHRTGVLVAVYRMEVDGWDARQAYQEMLDYDFYTTWGHGKMKTYVFDYYRNLKNRQHNLDEITKQTEKR